MTNNDQFNDFDDIVGRHIAFRRGEGFPVGLQAVPDEERELLRRELEIVDALLDTSPEPPPLSDDPVARRLGLTEGTDDTGIEAIDASLDPVRVSIEELVFRFAGAIACNGESETTGTEIGFLCRSISEAVLIVVLDDVSTHGLTTRSAHVFRSDTRVTAVVWTDREATNAALMSPSTASTLLIPTIGWCDPLQPGPEPLGIVLGRYFDRSLPRWDEVRPLVDDSFAGLDLDTNAAVNDEVRRVASSRPQLTHKRAARAFVTSLDPVTIAGWIADVRAGSLTGNDVAETISVLAGAESS